MCLGVLLPIVFLLSGCAALAFESIWFRIAATPQLAEKTGPQFKAWFEQRFFPVKVTQELP